MSTPIQNFYKATLTQDWSIGLGNFYVSIKPAITSGWLVISPSNDTLREIIKYTSTGTDANGDYIVISERGVDSTFEQTHTQGEKIRMNLSKEYWEEMQTDIANIVASGVPNANTTTMGGVEIATDAEVIAGTDIGSTGASLVATPGQINLKASKFTKTTLFISNGTFTKDSDSKMIKVIAFGAGGNGSQGYVGSSLDWCGGGGGARTEKDFISSSIPGTVAVTVAQTGGYSSTPTSFGTYLYAYNGGDGGGSNSNDGSGGAGGGSLGNGPNGVGTGTIIGGLPAITANLPGFAGQGAGNGNTGNGKHAEYGGASGGSFNNGAGGSSMYGGAGGGKGGRSTITVGSVGLAGGISGGINPGGGGTAGTAGAGSATAGNGGDGASRSGTGLGGDGGGGGGGSATGTSGNGGAGGIPGGGGGGGGSTYSGGTGGSGGPGGRGEIIVIEYF